MKIVIRLMEVAKIGIPTIMPNLPDLIKEVVIIEEQKKRQRKQQEKELERVYEEIAEPRKEEKEKPYKIEISLE